MLNPATIQFTNKYLQSQNKFKELEGVKKKTKFSTSREVPVTTAEKSHREEIKAMG